jgi:hypothetical protein
MGTAEVPNVVLVIIFVLVALASGAFVLTFATARASDFIVVPAASTVTGVALFATGMVITLLADLPLWLAVLIALAAAAAGGVLSTSRWDDHNNLALMVHDRQKASKKDDESKPASQAPPTVEA